MSVKSSGSTGSKTGGRKGRGCRSPTGTSSIISYKWKFSCISYLETRRLLILKNIITRIIIIVYCIPSSIQSYRSYYVMFVS